MSEFKLSPDELKAAHERTKKNIRQEVEYALEALRDLKDGKGANVSANTDIKGLLDYLPTTDVKPEDFGLTSRELPKLIEQYYEAVKDAP